MPVLVLRGKPAEMGEQFGVLAVKNAPDITGLQAVGPATHRAAPKASRRLAVYELSKRMLLPQQKLVFALMFYYGYGLERQITLTWAELAQLPMRRDFLRLVETTIRGASADTRPVTWWLTGTPRTAHMRWRDWCTPSEVKPTDIIEAGSRERVSRGMMPSRPKLADFNRGFRPLDAAGLEEMTTLWA